jgi:hypothetical protein
MPANDGRINEWLAKRAVGLEIDEVSKERIGRDPRGMSTTDLQALGLGRVPPSRRQARLVHLVNWPKGG